MDAGDVQVVDTLNDGAIPDLPADAVVEVPARIDRDGPHTLPARRLTPEMRGLVQHAKAYEQLAVEAALTGDRDVALRALIANPLVGRYDIAAPLLDELLPSTPRTYPSSLAEVGTERVQPGHNLVGDGRGSNFVRVDRDVRYRGVERPTLGIGLAHPFLAPVHEGSVRARRPLVDTNSGRRAKPNDDRGLQCFS